LRHVLIDTDPGVDDALALILALASPELRVEAVTTVAGNVSLERASVNALRLLEYMGAGDVPVAAGAAKPLMREARSATDIHGESGLGAAYLPEPRGRLDSRSAVELILEEVEELGGDLTIVPIGPLTNIASAILARPTIVEEVGSLVVMGGAFGLTPHGHGNVTPVAEFNVWHDPEAAKIVFDSGVPITAVGLDVTTGPGNRITSTDLKRMESLDTERSRLVADLCRDLIERFNGLSLHDPLALGVTIDRSLVETRRFSVEVETVSDLTRGMTVIDRRPRGGVVSPVANADVCASVDAERFRGLFKERVLGGGA
jgi:inosine-uridine nucleoside N-ribohydrolase